MAGRKSRSSNGELEVAAASSPVRVAAQRLDGGPGKALAVRGAVGGRLGAALPTHDIQTVFRPDVTITVSDDEYQQLLARGLVYSGDPVAPVADANDLSTADAVLNGPATKAALGAAYGLVRDQVLKDTPAAGYTKLGVILAPAFSWDAALVEGPGCVFIDPVSGRLAMTYTGYSSTNNTGVGSVGIAFSDDGGVTWPVADRRQYLTSSGTSGAPDEFGVTGGVVWFDYDAATEHIFYIGLTALGYEQGTKTLCHASRPIGGTTWTRHGTIIAPTGGFGWRSLYVWKPNLVQRGDKFYLFVNASGQLNAGDTEHERVGVFQADSIDGPWTEVPGVNPLFPVDPTDGSKVYQGDPVVQRLSDGTWRMDYFRAKTAVPQAAWNRWATTTDEAFPGGWVDRGISLSPGAAGSVDETFAHKGYPYRWGGRSLLPYTAQDAGGNKRIALAIAGVTWETATDKSNEATRSTTSTSLTSADSTTSVIDPTDKPLLQFRILVRGNPGPTATMTVQGVTRLNPSATAIAAGAVTLTGNSWQNAVGAWVPVTVTAPEYHYAQFKSSDGTAVQLAGVWYEYRWARV